MGASTSTSLTISFGSSATVGVSPGTTQTSAGATELPSHINVISAVGTAGDGVRLPTLAAGALVVVENRDTADALNVWPATGGKIGAGGADSASSLAATKVAAYYYLNTIDVVKLPGA